MSQAALSVPLPPVTPAQLPPAPIVSQQGPTPVPVQPSQTIGQQLQGPTSAQQVTGGAPVQVMPALPPVCANLDPPHYAMMQNVLLQAMQQQSTETSPITMEDLANFLLSQGRSSAHYPRQRQSGPFEKSKPRH